MRPHGSESRGKARELERRHVCGPLPAPGRGALATLTHGPWPPGSLRDPRHLSLSRSLARRGACSSSAAPSSASGRAPPPSKEHSTSRSSAPVLAATPRPRRVSAAWPGTLDLLALRGGGLGNRICECFSLMSSSTLSSSALGSPGWTPSPPPRRTARRAPVQVAPRLELLAHRLQVLLHVLEAAAEVDDWHSVGSTGGASRSRASSPLPPPASPPAPPFLPFFHQDDAAVGVAHVGDAAVAPVALATAVHLDLLLGGEHVAHEPPLRPPSPAIDAGSPRRPAGPPSRSCRGRRRRRHPPR